MIRRPATQRILLARAIAIVATIVAYVVVRGPYLTSAIELAVSWSAMVFLAFWFERTMMRWDTLRHAATLVTQSRAAAIQAGEPTEVMPAVTGPTWPTETDTMVEIARLDELTRFEEGEAKVVDRGVFVEPELFTHEYNPLTPPRGIPAVAAEPEYTGRHRLDAHMIARTIASQTGMDR